MKVEGSLYLSRRVEDRSLEKLSTGLRINRASDDAAGLAISEKLRSQFRGSSQARKNAMDGISLLTVADGGASEITSIIQRMRELAIQSATDTVTTNERQYLQAEYKQLHSEIDRISESTMYNGQHLLNGTSGFGTSSNGYIHIGANGTSDDGLAISYGRLQTAKIGLSDEMLRGTLSFSGKLSSSENVAITIEFDGTSNVRGKVLSANGSGAYNSPAANSDVTGIELLDAASNAISVKDALEDWSKVAYISADLSGDSMTNAINPLKKDPVGWRNWPASGVSYSPGGNAGINGTEVKETSSIDTQKTAMDAIFLLDSALNTTNRVRADIGSYMNRLTHSVNNLMTSEINQQAAESQIRDTDFAEEASKLTRQQVLSQSATAMLAQAKATPQSVLSLIR